MGVNKNFVVKNGLEVNENLILADASTKNVGIGSTIPARTLDVAGGIAATNFYSSGISTFADEVLFSDQLKVGTGGTVLTALGAGSSVGIGTNLPGYLLEVRSPVSTGQTALYVYGDVRISGDINADDLFFDDIVALDLDVSGIGTIATLNSTEADITNLRSTNLSGTIGTITNLSSTNLSGTIGTITTLESTSGTITNLTGTIGTITDLSSTNLSGTIGTITTLEATSGEITNLNVSGFSTFTGFSTFASDVYVAGVVTATSFYGDGSNLDGLPNAGVGLQTAGGFIGQGVTTLDFRGPGISTITVSSGIGTINITGGGGSGSISISTEAPASPSSGDLWYSPDYARTFIWYDESTVGYGTSANWVDAAPSNGGSGSGGSTRVSISTAAPSSPSNGDLWYSVDYGRTFIWYDEPTIGIGSTSVWVDAAPYQPANSSLTIHTRDTGAVILSIVGTGLTISLRSGVGTASF
tara:strand:+ start:596 stop:2005 length:1410 start_codon:yes stop_codon:yes gene_type:complete